MNRLGALSCTLSAIASVGLGFLYTQRLEAEVSGGPRTSVLVAAEDIPIGAVLSEKMLAIRELPRAYIESRHIFAKDTQRVVGKRVTEGIKANEALLGSDVTKFSEHKQLSAVVANGMRAISIEGRAADFDGLLRPGDRVDVLLSQAAGDFGGATITLLQSLLVLSVGGTLERSDGNARTYSRGATVTVSTTVEQAQVLTEAMRRGKLTLTLRNTDDITLVEGITETSAKELTRNVQAPRSATPSPTKPSTVAKGGPVSVH